MESGFNIAKKNACLRLLRWMLLVVILGVFEHTHAQLTGLRITEVMSRNGSALFDDFGETPDWVELTNYTDASVDLRNYSLSIDSAQAVPYRFPHYILESGERVIVFCSGKQLRHAPKKLQLDLQKPVIEGELLHLDAGNPGSIIYHENRTIQEWQDQSSQANHAVQTDPELAPKFSLIAPQQVPAIFFDGEDDFLKLKDVRNARTILSVVAEHPFATDHARAMFGHSFAIPMIRGANHFLLHPLYSAHLLRYGSAQDGRVIDAAIQPAPEFLSLIRFQTEQPRFINFIASDRQIANQYWHGWFSEILLYDHILTPDERVEAEHYLMERWGLPRKHLHAPFKIPNESGVLHLTTTGGERVDSFVVTETRMDTSLSRNETSGLIGITEISTPGLRNEGPFLKGVLTEVDVSLEAGAYANPVEVVLSHQDPDAEIRYTLDGNPPGLESPIYEGPITINETTVLRAAAIRSGYLPGPICSNTYLIQFATSIPVLSLSGAPDDWWSDESGIYVKGPDAKTEIPHFGANFWREWERPTDVEWIDTNGIRRFVQSAGAKIHGGWSRAAHQKSIALIARSRYGENRFRGSFFEDRENMEFKQLLLRNTGNDFTSAMLRDVVSQSLMADFGLETQAYRPVQVLLNGEYLGLFHLRERANEHFISNNTGIPTENIDLVDNTFESLSGDHRDLYVFSRWLLDADTSGQSFVEDLEGFMDVDAFMDYVITQIAIDNQDWPDNNVRVWKERSENGRWRWLPFDLDASFDPLKVTIGNNTLGKLLSLDTRLTSRVLNAMIQNPTFKDRFIKRYQHRLNTTFTSANMLAHIDLMADGVREEMPRQIQKYGGLPLGTHVTPATMDEWEANVNHMREFANQRPFFLWQHFAETFELRTPLTLSINVPSVEKGHLIVNGFEVRHEFGELWEARFFTELPMELTAIPAPGFQFKGWAELGEVSETVIVQPDKVRSITPVFKQIETVTSLDLDPFPIATLDYQFTAWPSTTAPGTRPASMAFLASSEPDPGLTTESLFAWGEDYNSSNRSRIIGLGDAGVAFKNTDNPYPGAKGGYAAGAVLALNTQGTTNLFVQWTAGQMSDFDQPYAIRMQYRIGRSNPFVSVVDSTGRPVEFISHAGDGPRIQVMGPVELPARLTGQPYVELRWKYYALEENRDDGRPTLRLDDITVSTQPITTNQISQTGQVRISEIMYHPSTHRPNEEFIEIVNVDDHPIQLAGWNLDRGVRFEFPSYILQPGAYAVISADREAFAEAYPTAPFPLGPWNGKLGNSGEKIRLKDVVGDVVDEVRYADEGEWSQRVRGPLMNGHRGWTWSNAHDGDGYSLERILLSGWSDVGQNWSASQSVQGTPGAINSVHSESAAPFISNVQHVPVVPKSSDHVSISANIDFQGQLKSLVELHYRKDGTPDFSIEIMREAGEGLFTAHIPPMPDGTVVEFFVRASNQDTQTRNWPNATSEGQIANALYQVDDQVHTTNQPLARVITTEAERKELESIGQLPWNASSDAQMNATFIMEENGSFEVRYLTGFRIRGTTSRVLNPKNRRVNFASDADWRGRLSIIFNAVNVPSQVLGSALFRFGGVLAPACRPVTFLENNLNHANSGFPQFGSYAQLEVLDDRFTERQFKGDGAGNLYRAFGFGSLDYLGPDPLEYQKFGFYTKSTNVEENDWSDLIRFTRLLQETPQEDYQTVAESLLQVESWLRYFAVDTLVANMETSLANGGVGDYAFYLGEDDSRVTLLPYDLDSILGMTVSGLETSIFRATANPAPEKFLKSPGFARRYYSLLVELANGLFEPSSMDRVVGTILGEWTGPEFVDRIQDFARQRRASVISQIPRTLSVQVDLPLAEPDYLRYYRADADEMELQGRADVLKTDRILVQGMEADWTVWSGQWFIGNVPLHEGVNEILIEAFDEQGRSLEQLRIRVFKEGEPDILYSGVLAEDTVWSPATSPIRVENDLIIPQGVTLTILPGTSVEFMQGAGLIVRGQLKALGTESNRIYFAAQRFAAQRWGGLRFESTMEHNELNYVTIEWTLAKAGIHLEQSRLDIMGGRWIGAYNSFLVSFHSSLHLKDCIFPDVTNGEPIAGIGIPDGGYWIVEGCELGRTTGYADIIDFTGGKLPGPVPQFLNNRFFGGSDDGLDLDGGDGYVEGNLFMNFQKANASSSEAHAIATGLYEGATSNVTIVRNVFFNNDHDILLKEGAQAHVAHNTFVDSRIGSISLRELERRTQPPGSLFMEGNIFDATNVLHALESVLKSKPDFSVVIQDSILPEAWAHFGERNHDLDPVFVDKEALDFRLSDRSPVLGLGPLGLDPGAFVLPGLAVKGLPWTSLPSTDLNLDLGGPGVIAYRYRLDGGEWSETFPVSESLELNGLQEGVHQLEWLDQNTAGQWRSEENPIRSPEWEVASSASPIRLSEVYAAKVPWDANESRKWEFIEIVNLGNRVHLLKDYSLSDDLNDPFKYQFAPIALAEPGQRVVVGENGQSSIHGWILPFKLNRAGESIYLFRQVNGQAILVDQIQFGWQANGWSVGRDQTGHWQAGLPSPEKANQKAKLGSPGDVQITEWFPLEWDSYSMGFVEIANLGSAPVSVGQWSLSQEPDWLADAFSFPRLSFLAPGEFRILEPGNGANDLRDDLNTEHDLWALNDEHGKNIDRIWYANPLAGLSWRRDLDQPDQIISGKPTPGAGDALAPEDALIVINEIAADNRNLLSPWSTFADWIELWNPTATAFPLEGLTLTDNLDLPAKWSFPDGAFLEPFGFLQIWFDGSMPPNDRNTGFGLKAGGDQVWLFDAANRGGLVLDTVEFGTQIPGHTLGRHPEHFEWVLTEASPGQVNVPAILGESDFIRINEWMADPSTGSDWFELFNSGESPVALSHLQLSDDPLDPSKHVFPPHSFLGTDVAAYLKMDADGNGGNPRDVNFKLSAGGESILLSNEQGVMIDRIDFDRQTEGVSQGRWPDGGGDVFDFVLTESPGRLNEYDGDQDGLPDLWELENGFNPLAIGEAFQDLDGDGHDNFQEFLANTDPEDANQVLVIEQANFSEGSLSLVFSAKKGRGYEIQRSHQLESGQWETIWEVNPLLEDRELNLNLPAELIDQPPNYFRLRAQR